MYRSFITTIVAAAVAITSVNVSTADAGSRDDKLAKYLAGAAALVIIGSALNNQNTRSSKKKKKVQVHQPQTQRPYVQQHQPRKHDQARPRHKNNGHYTHTQRGRADALPRRCVRDVPRRNGDSYRTIASNCLKRHYHGARNLPRVCRESVKMNGKWRATYKLRCLRDKGYRVARH